MIYVMSEKFFSKNVKKLVKHHAYFGLDGANYSVIAGSSYKEAVASKYNRFHSAGGFCPENRLYRFLKKKKDGEEVNEARLEKEIKEFLTDKSFIAAVRTAFMAENSKYPDTLNIFVVLPNIVWKYLGKQIVKKMIKLSKMDFEFIFTQEDIEDNFKLLKRELTADQMKDLDKRVKKMEKKYDLKFIGGDEM